MLFQTSENEGNLIERKLQFHRSLFTEDCKIEIMARPSLRGAPMESQQEEELNMSEADVDMSDMGAIMAALKMGTTMTKLPSKAKGRVEQKTFQLNLDEFKISWFRGAGSKEEGSSEFFYCRLKVCFLRTK